MTDPNVWLFGMWVGVFVMCVFGYGAAVRLMDRWYTVLSALLMAFSAAMALYRFAEVLNP